MLENRDVGLTAHIILKELGSRSVVRIMPIPALGCTSLGALQNTTSVFSPVLAIGAMLGMFNGRLNNVVDYNTILCIQHLVKLTDKILKSHVSKLDNPQRFVAAIIDLILEEVNTAVS
ncbi:hypothetical protein N9384_00340 [bacterium]|nr:hypothetical protein [bacterium]